MSSSCYAIGYTECYSKVKGVKIYRFFIDPDRRKAWVNAIK